jgi:hypothetical protein
MSHNNIRGLTRAVPFRAFLTGGETFDIRHPDMIIATPGAAHIAVPAASGPADAAERVAIVSLVHIQKVEYLPVALSPGAAANGAA